MIRTFGERDVPSTKASVSTAADKQAAQNNNTKTALTTLFFNPLFTHLNLTACFIQTKTVKLHQYQALLNNATAEAVAITFTFQ
jgi:hypothetical protein